MYSPQLFGFWEPVSTKKIRPTLDFFSSSNKNRSKIFIVLLKNSEMMASVLWH